MGIMVVESINQFSVATGEDNVHVHCTCRRLVAGCNS